MEIRIGVQNVAREITLETEAPAQEVVEKVRAAMKDASVLHLEDDKGRQVFVPGASVGYVWIGESEKGRVGFAVT